jgi:hypothetical protein
MVFFCRWEDLHGELDVSATTFGDQSAPEVTSLTNGDNEVFDLTDLSVDARASTGSAACVRSSHNISQAAFRKGGQ